LGGAVGWVASWATAMGMPAARTSRQIAAEQMWGGAGLLIKTGLLAGTVISTARSARPL
jgi:hypothetical protein